MGLNTCLICGYEPDEVKEEHLPKKVDTATGVYVCSECLTRCQTVTSFGLTVDELRKAAIDYKKIHG